jgi:hypothetical protein
MLFCWRLSFMVYDAIQILKIATAVHTLFYSFPYFILFNLLIKFHFLYLFMIRNQFIKITKSEPSPAISYCFRKPIGPDLHRFKLETIKVMWTVSQSCPNVRNSIQKAKNSGGGESINNFLEGLLRYFQ